ncbi:MAG TPA: DUF202 domain-containing protein [Hyphomicrobiales bacterium]|nr:DUF202 domain-containing protein [Hyphomicrobiales bacterium]
MIRNFNEHAANERTFLAWIRTGVTVIGFGFVLERFTIFMAVITANASAEIAKAAHSERLGSPLGRYEGLAFMLTGIVLIILAYWRFLRTGQLIDDAAPRPPIGVRAEVAVAAIVVALTLAYCVYILAAL